MNLGTHPLCEPPDEDDTIWRYMDFTEFVSMLEKEQLFFNRADRLGDPYEGSLPWKYYDFWEKKLREYPEEWVEELLPRFREICTKHTFLSCWHINNEGESAAMWDLYLESNQGICIKSSFGDFITSIEDNHLPNTHMTKVIYKNYEETDPLDWGIDDPLGDTLFPFIHKRISYKHEQEMRAIIHDLPWQSDDGQRYVSAENIRNAPLEEEALNEKGRHIHVDLDKLIDEIYIAPQAGGWVKKLVEDVADTYELEGASKDDFILKSSMGKDPLY